MSQRSRWSAYAWYWQRISGILLVIFTLGHYVTVHWTEAAGHSFQSSVERLANPLFQFWYLGFVVLGFYHGVQGLYNILRDYKLPRALLWGVMAVVIAAALYFTYLGFDTVLSVHTWKSAP
jgi:succinate dehydrogenase hydrophobic anchor subunit